MQKKTLHVHLGVGIFPIFLNWLMCYAHIIFMHIYYNFYATFWTKFENEKNLYILSSLQCSIRVLVAILFLLDDVPLGVFLFSPVGERALLGVLLLGGTVDFVFGELCLTRLCLNGSVLTVADNPVLVGVVSLEDGLLPPLHFQG